MKKDRLTPDSITIDPAYMSDYLLLMAHNIEEALLFMGAEPGKDYTYKDLVNWAIELTKTNDKLKFHYYEDTD